MAQKTGLVQRIYMGPGTATEVQACVFIGPTPANLTLLLLRRQASDPAHTGAFLTSMLDALTQALTSRHEVIVGHGDSDSNITSVELT
jgi:hypothetical protein